MNGEMNAFRRQLLEALACGCSVLALGRLTSPVLAAEAPAAPSTVQLTAVALPIVVDGRLINYVFVTVKLALAPGVDGASVRAKEPFFRDALVRAGHRRPFVLANDYTHIDVGRVCAEVMSDSVGIVGRGVVRRVEVVKQVSQHRYDLPTAGVSAPGPELIP
jgi:hypothetical protein